MFSFTLLVLVIGVLVFQLVLFFLGRSRKQNVKKENISARFNIKSRNDAWKLLNNPKVSARDKLKIEELYKSM
ncbi:MAG: hypothetical protein IH947_06425 [Bacteroidetes bacterium]|nr:hypothetical protein [Bacteroidota bacterium]MCH8232066.1 hypothetical protein [Bacteroidota bacterium]